MKRDDGILLWYNVLINSRLVGVVRARNIQDACRLASGKWDGEFKTHGWHRVEPKGGRDA